MTIRMRRALLAAGVATALVLPLSSQASDGTISFVGGVTANTCTVTVNGTAGASTSINLPIVSTSALTSGAGKTTAAGTFFNIAVSGCSDPAVNDAGFAGTPSKVSVFFEAGTNVNPTTGGLVNTAASGSNVEVSLYTASSGSTVGTLIHPGASTGQAAPLNMTDGGTQWFFAGYSTTGVAATAGAVTTQVTYSLVYQ
jgi:major type 1 subunit fimbrin (pilin)